MNRLLQQFARDGHLTFKKKCRDLILQIFGHEGLYDNQDHLADVATCDHFDVHLYRFSRVELKKDLALRKVLNPFKWMEFIITAPLELLGWGLQRSPFSIYRFIEKNDKKIKQWPLALNVAFSIASFILIWLLSISSFFVNLAVNLITGIVRRLLAPARYLIRPTIEMAIEKPETFALLLLLSAGMASFLLISIFTGGLPLLALGGAILASLGAKIFLGGFTLLATWALTLKTATVLREFWKAAQEKWERNPSSKLNQYQRVYRLNGQIDYPLHILLTDDIPEIKTLSQYNNKLPLLIGHNNRLWVYGRAPQGKAQTVKTQLTEIKKPSAQTLQFIQNVAKPKKGFNFIVMSPDYTDYRVSIPDENNLFLHRTAQGGYYYYSASNGAKHIRKEDLKDCPPIEWDNTNNCIECTDASFREAIFKIAANRGDHFKYTEPSSDSSQVFTPELREIPKIVYSEIAQTRAHFRERAPGKTIYVSRTVHAMNHKLSPMRDIHQQSTGYQLALLAGVEMIFFRKKPQQTDPRGSNLSLNHPPSFDQ